MHVRIVLPLLFLLALILFAVAKASPPTRGATANNDESGATLWLLRHAEAGSGPDPALTPAGVRRADAWHATLGTPTLRRVYATDTRRSRDTAAAIAADAGAEVEIYDPAQPGALVERLRERAEPALVVAHSNTLNELAQALGAGADLRPIAHDEHDRTYALPLVQAPELTHAPAASVR